MFFLFNQLISIQMVLFKHPTILSTINPLLIGLVTSYLMYN